MSVHHTTYVVKREASDQEKTATRERRQQLKRLLLDASAGEDGLQSIQLGDGESSDSGGVALSRLLVDANHGNRSRWLGFGEN
jgi:hypothetical protein